MRRKTTSIMHLFLAGRALTRARRVAVAIALTAWPCASLNAEDTSIFGELQRARTMQLRHVEHYVERVKGGEIPGMRIGLPDGQAGPCISSCRVFKVETIVHPDGTEHKQERALTMLEVQIEAGIDNEAFARIYGTVLLSTQAAMNEAVGGYTLFGHGVPAPGGETTINDSLNHPEELVKQQAWLNPFLMLAAGGVMLLEGADAIRDAKASVASGSSQVEAQQELARAVADNLVESGDETLNGIPATRYSASGLDMLVESGDGPQIYFNGGSMWVDTTNYVLVGHRIEGTMVADGESRAFYIEVQNSDFRSPPGCGEMYEPFRRTMRMGGVLNEDQTAQLRQAKQQLEEMEATLASTPAEQRSMVESMIGPAMESLRSMSDDGSIEYVEEVEEILCNPDLKALFMVDAGQLLAAEGYDLTQIQRHLETLGYEPGNTDGILDELTRVAISWFQAENAMVVTGEPSVQLAAALIEEIQSQSS